jgi:hypothetical protein
MDFSFFIRIWTKTAERWATNEFGNELGAAFEGELVDFGLVLVLFLGDVFGGHGDGQRGIASVSVVIRRCLDL